MQRTEEEQQTDAGENCIYHENQLWECQYCTPTLTENVDTEATTEPEDLTVAEQVPREAQNSNESLIQQLWGQSTPIKVTEPTQTTEAQSLYNDGKYRTAEQPEIILIDEEIA